MADNEAANAAKFGAAGTSAPNIAPTNIGGLGNLSQSTINLLGGQDAVKSAVALAKELIPKPEPFDPDLAAFLFFTKMGEAASKPGATALGAAATGAQEPVKYLMEKRKNDRAAQAAVGPMAVQLATLLKGKPGAPKVVEMGPALKTNGSAKIDPTSGKPLFTHVVYNADGSRLKTYEAIRKGGGVNVSVGGQKKFGEVFSTKQATAFSTQLEGSQASADSLATIRTLSDVLRNPDFDTGAWEQFKLPLKQLAVSFGVGSQEDIDSVASAEAFRAKAQELVLASVAKMKGALSDKELGFLESQNVSLGKSKQGNQLLLLLSEQQLEKAAGFSDFRLKWEDENSEVKTSRDYARMISDFRGQESMKENPYQYVMRKVKTDLRKRLVDAGARFDVRGNVVEGSISGELQAQFASEVSSKYNVPLVKKVFSNSGFSR